MADQVGIVKKIETIAPGLLSPSAYNPRTISPQEFAKLRRSLREFGFVEPVVVNNGNKIIGGHQRVRAAIEEGLKRVPIVRLDLPEKKAQALNLALNRISGEWDLPLLKDLLGQLSATPEFDVDTTGFDQTELEKLLPWEFEEERVEPKKLILRAAELRKKWKTKHGQLWEVASKSLPGRCHRIHCADRLEISAIDAALTVTDPPYNSLRSWKKDKAKAETRLDPAHWFEGDNLAWPAYEKFLGDSFLHLVSHSTYVFTDFRVYPLVVRQLVQAGYSVKHCIVWKKNVWGLGKRYRFQHEFIVYACKGAAPFYGDRSQSDVWEADVVKRAPHNTPKPTPLFANAIRNSSKRGDTVFDPFLGSGTAIVAAEQLGRLAVGIELEPRYVAVALERLKNLGLKPSLAK